MTNADLIWKLMEKISEQEKELNQAIEIIQKYNLKLDSMKQKEVR